jgi:hypothetical protein
MDVKRAIKVFKWGVKMKLANVGGCIPALAGVTADFSQSKLRRCVAWSSYDVSWWWLGSGGGVRRGAEQRAESEPDAGPREGEIEGAGRVELRLAHGWLSGASRRLRGQSEAGVKRLGRETRAARVGAGGVGRSAARWGTRGVGPGGGAGWC